MTDNPNTEWGHAPGDIQWMMLQPEAHTGKFYFKRAFLTTFAILTAISAFLVAWMIIWALTLGGLWGLGQSDGEGINMQDEPSSSDTSNLPPNNVLEPTTPDVDGSCDTDFELC